MHPLHIIVGMSGGVDSSVAAYLLIKAGHHVEGLFMKNWEADDTDTYCPAAKDLADAEAICEAVARPNMRFVPVKNPEQQALLGLHRARQGFVAARTAQANQIRGLLAEFGIVFAKGIGCVTRKMPEVLEDAENGLPGTSRELFSRLFGHFRELDRQVKELEGQIQAWHREDTASLRLQAIPGIGPLTASALVASIADARMFKNGRQMAAWLGLVPRQSCTGGKSSVARHQQTWR